MIGFETPDVFNKTDLKMSNKWGVLSSVLYSENTDYKYCNSSWNLLDPEIVPITLTDGSKGYYQQCDILYFGNTSLYRRILNNINPNNFHQSHLSNNHGLNDLIKSRIRFDYAIQNRVGKYLYKLEFYYKESYHSNKKVLFELFYLADKNNVESYNG